MKDLFYKLPQSIAARRDLRSSDKLVYAVVLNCFNGKGICWPGKRDIMKKTGLADKTVCDAIDRLNRAGVLVVERRGNGKSNNYTLPQESGSESEPVQRPNRFRNYTTGGSESEPEAVQRVNPNYKRSIEKTDYAFVLKNNSHWPLLVGKFSEYEESFPDIDLHRELRKARQWLIDNPEKRKTAKGMPRFLSGWLGSAKPTPAEPTGGYIEDVDTIEQIYKEAGL